MIAVNVTALVELLQSLIPAMAARAQRAHGRGGIIVVSSATALAASPSLATYGATKAFQLHLTRTLAREFADEPLDFLALCPTYTRTRFFARAGLPMPSRAMSPEVVAREGLAALGRRQAAPVRNQAAAAILAPAFRPQSGAGPAPVVQTSGPEGGPLKANIVK